MTMFRNYHYPSCVNASRSCLASGEWEPLTYYNDCANALKTQVDCEENMLSNSNTSLYIYLVGYIISFLALSAAMLVFLSFRELQYLRHKIHLGLFLSFGLSAFFWISESITLLITEAQPIHTDLFTSIICLLHVLTSFFHITKFYWMFIEGFYLFLQVQFPLSLASIKYKHFLIFGWGAPLISKVVWIILRLSSLSDQHCPFLDIVKWDVVLEAPILTLLVINFLFLTWVVIIVVSKLNQQAVLDHEKRHFKAAKALICVCPLLGISYLLTLWTPNIFQNIFIAIRDFILSFQGLVISIIFCLANEEVQNVLRTHWKRRMMVRMVKKEGRMRSISMRNRDEMTLMVDGDHSNITQLTVT